MVDDTPPPGTAPTSRPATGDGAADEHGIFFRAVSTTRMPMIVTDPNRHDNPIVFANPAFLNMTGYRREEILGRNCRFLQGPDTDPDTVSEVRIAIAQRRETAVEILNYKKSGAAFWNALFISPMFASDGTLQYFFASQLDVTRRRDAESALRQAQKMEAVGQLTGGIAHDFNNLLTVIAGFGEIVLNQIDQPDGPDPARTRRAINAVLAATERAATLTQQMLAFARKQKLQGRVVDIVDLLEQIRPTIERTLGPSIRFRLLADSASCNARLDPAQAELALINILANARDAMPEGGDLTIETSTRRIDAGDKGYGRLPPGPYAVVTLTDTGAGMSADILSRVTEPFFTTKDTGQGTGLGLSMVYGFMKQSEGTLHIYSEPGVGTTIRLLFPQEDSPTQPLATMRPNPVGGGHETILLVEDQKDVGDYAEEILRELGYTVHRAHSPQQALDELEAIEHLDLLFTDLIMPGGMNGVTLAHEARRHRPGIRVLLTTGYAESSIERVDARGAEFDVLQKPYKRSDLAARVRRAIEGPNGIS